MKVASWVGFLAMFGRVPWEEKEIESLGLELTVELTVELTRTSVPGSR